MNLREAWRLSKAPYVELTYRSVKLSRGSTPSGFGYSRDPNKFVKNLIRSGRISKIVFTVFICLIPLFTLLSYVFRKTPTSLASSVALALVFTFAYFLVYLLQVLTSLSSGEPFAFLSSLPMSQRDFSLVSTLSVLRTLDYMVVGAVVSQSLIVGLITGSPLVAGLILVVSLVNIAFAVAIGIWLSVLFYRNITRGGRSRLAGLTRALFLLGWGLVVGSIWFSFSFISILLSAIRDAISPSPDLNPIGLVLSIIYPFSAGILVSSFVYGIINEFGVLSISALTAFVLYLMLASISIRWTASTISGAIHGGAVKISREAAKDFLIRVRSPIVGYLVKDLRVASKNPSTAFIFALPVLETVLVGLNILGHSSRANVVIPATMLGSGFILFSATGLLNTEGTGLDYTLSLPISPKTIIRAKSLAATATYVPVLTVILILLSLGRPTSWILFLIPLVEVPAILAGTSVQLSFFIKGYRRALSTGARTSSSYSPRGLNFLSAGGLVQLILSLITAGIIIAAPLLSYVLTFFLTVDRVESILLMTATSMIEFVIVQVIINRF